MDENSGDSKRQALPEQALPFPPASQPATCLVRLDRIHPDPQQPRKHFDTAALQELADSIRSMGLIQPPALRPHPDPALCAEGAFMLICGERRWRASRLAGLSEIRCEIHERLSELDVRRQQFSENYARQDLNLVEEAEALQASIDSLASAGYQAPQRTLAAALGMTESTLSRKLRVLKIHPEVRALVRDGLVTQVNALAALDKLTLDQRTFFVNYARATAGTDTPPDVAGFLKDPRKFIQQRQPEAAAPPPSSPETKAARHGAWAVRWTLGRAEFATLCEKTGYPLLPAVIEAASEAELRAHFEAFRGWLLDVKHLVREMVTPD